MAFLRANIDRAIVMTQYDLRGFLHALSFRIKANTPKYIFYATANLLSFAAGRRGEQGERGCTDEQYVDFFECSFEDYLAMCKRLAKDCDSSQREAIQLIIADILKQHQQMGEKIAAGDHKGWNTSYHKSISKDNEWGRAILALQEAFAPTPEKEAAAA